jgi:hypothetical protein
MLKHGEADLIILDHKLPWAAVEAFHLGDEAYVAIESAHFTTRQDVYLDINPNDQVTERFFQFQGAGPRYRRAYMADVYGIIDGVALGIGRAVVPRHMLAGRQDVRVLTEYRAQPTAVWLQHFTLPCYSRLHQAVVEVLTRACPEILATG